MLRILADVLNQQQAKHLILRCTKNGDGVVQSPTLHNLSKVESRANIVATQSVVSIDI